MQVLKFVKLCHSKKVVDPAKRAAHRDAVDGYESRVRCLEDEGEISRGRLTQQFARAQNIDAEVVRLSEQVTKGIRWRLGWHVVTRLRG